MKTSKFTESQIMAILKQGASGQYLWLAGGLSYSYNSYTGQTFSGNIGVCVGLKGVVSVGPEIGGSLYVNHEGDIMGATAYAELQASAFGGLTSAVVGYESGSVGMEGRGLFAGATVAGIHGELTHIEKGPGGVQGSWGLQESMYFGVGDTHGTKVAKNIQKTVHLEFWLPSLGNFGHIMVGDTYDTSKPGLGKAQQGALIDLLKPYLENDEDARKWYDKIKAKGSNLNAKELGSLMTYLESKGCQTMTLTWPFDWSFKTDKKVVWANGQNGYPHIEFKYNQDGSGTAYSSYNYGSNLVSHLLIDWVGYYLPRLVYGVED